MKDLLKTPCPTLRIMHVVDSLEVGGLERVVTDLALEQQAQGHHVSVFSIQTTEGFKSELTRQGVQVTEGHKAGTLDMAVLKALREESQAQGLDIVHAHNFVPNYHAAAALIGLKRRPAQVCTCHDMGQRLRQPRLRALFKASLWRTRQVAMVGTQVYRHFVNAGLVPAAKASTVLNGIPVERFDSSEHLRQQARRALGVPDDALLLGCVGRLVGLKNHAQLIRLMPALLRTHPQAHLAVIGGGPLATDLAQLVKSEGLTDHVTLAGARQAVSALLPALDVFVLPSETEGLSIALLEAAATGLAIVATAVGGNTEIIRDGETGLLVPVNEDQALLEALLKLAGDTTLRARLGQAAQTWVRQHASTAALVTAYDKVYHDALKPATVR